MSKWDEIKTGVKSILGSSEPEKESINKVPEYLKKLVEDLEQKVYSDQSLKFRIEQIKTNGVSVKVNGLFAYLSFLHMPWSYPNLAHWQAIAPSLLGKTFYGKVFNIKTNPLFILMNGESHKFEDIDLIIGEPYNAIIVNKAPYGLFVDIGYHFDWEYGSYVGLIHNSNIAKELFAKKTEGDIIETYYLGINAKEQLIFGNNDRIRNWVIGNPYKLLGQIVSAKISKKNDKLEILVEDKYKGTLPVNGELYQTETKKLNSAIRNLLDNDIIQCEVYKINDAKMSLQLKWTFEEEIEAIFLRNIEPVVGKKTKKKEKKAQKKELGNSIANNIVGDDADKLKLVGQSVNVEIEKNDNENKYIVENKYNGKLIISNKKRLITTREKEIIESNIQDGEILECEVIGINEEYIKVRWFINDDDFVRFTT